MIQDEMAKRFFKCDGVFNQLVQSCSNQTVTEIDKMNLMINLKIMHP